MSDELPMVWGELWLDQLYVDHRRAIVASFDDFARLAIDQEAANQEAAASGRQALFGWLATASDDDFAESSCDYLEKLLGEAVLPIDHISRLMMLLGRARFDARRELGPALDRASSRLRS